MRGHGLIGHRVSWRIRWDVPCVNSEPSLRVSRVRRWVCLWKVEEGWEVSEWTLSEVYQSRRSIRWGIGPTRATSCTHHARLFSPTFSLRTR